ncbi:IS3 family transposase [uncultured Clostridium sp.]|uniref:IS3 family transposase n=1 Tax=uncultured Clostridium sp. TaxID=59620 RepID=UPI0025D96114|nr:IS3 family transposase [uncultured Clostridium sp.]
MYSDEKREAALKYYHQCGSVTETVIQLGYPSKCLLYKWLKKENQPPMPRKKAHVINTSEHPRHPSVEVKLNALHRCFELGEDIKLVSEDIGYSRASIYKWRKKYLRKGTVALMNERDIRPGKLEEGHENSDTKEIEILKEKMLDMQLEIDILKETINVLKKDPGIDQTALKNREKAVIVDALKNKYSLPLLLEKLELAKSCYYYQEKVFAQKDKYLSFRKEITKLFYENKSRYGYRRIHGLLSKKGIIISEKIVRKIMKEEHLIVKAKKRRKYNSYQGEITPAVENKIKRNFYAEKPNQKWLTDITEFSIPAGKIYLSAIVDCFDGMLPCWTIGISPDAHLVNTMLDKAITSLKDGEKPIVHSDRGCHYRWSGWIKRMNKAGLTRSMSKKGCSPDNSACEGLFGRLKNEMFYNTDWTGISINTFIDILNDYLMWYNNERIKVSLGNMSPREYRQSLGLAA